MSRLAFLLSYYMQPELYMPLACFPKGRIIVRFIAYRPVFRFKTAFFRYVQNYGETGLLFSYFVLYKLYRFGELLNGLNQ